MARLSAMHPAILLVAALLLASGCVSNVHSARSLAATSEIINGHGVSGGTHDDNLANAACFQPDVSFFCNLLTLAAKTNPVVKSLYNGSTVATVFAPTNRGINNTRSLMLRYMGLTLTSLSLDPIAATKFVLNHVVLGSAPDYRNWRTGGVLTNALTPGQALTQIEGTGRNTPPGVAHQFFIRGPLNVVRAGFQGRSNVIGGKGFVQVIEDPIIPPPWAYVAATA